MGTNTTGHKSAAKPVPGRRDSSSNPTPAASVKKVPVVSDVPVRTNPNKAPSVGTTGGASHPAGHRNGAGHR